MNKVKNIGKQNRGPNLIFFHHIFDQKPAEEKSCNLEWNGLITFASDGVTSVITKIEKNYQIFKQSIKLD